MRLSPAITLSALLLSFGYGQNIIINPGDTKNETISSGTIDSIQLTGNGQFTLTSSGNSTVKDMQMYWLNDGASANFIINGGSLDLNLAMIDAFGAKNTVTFDVKTGGTLNLTNGKNGTAHGIFQGLGTTLTANIANGATLNGDISNDTKTTINIDNGGKLNGGITQTGGELSVTIEGTLNGSIIANKNATKTSLWAYEKNQGITSHQSTITGSISIEGGQLEGVVRGLELQGSYTQTGGKSDIAFHHSDFKSATILSDAETTIHFYASKLTSLSVNNGTTTINLKGDETSKTGGSTMEGYTGTGGNTTLNLIEGSSMKNASQSAGTLNATSDNSTINGSISGSNNALLNIDIKNKTKLQGSINNNGVGSKTSINSLDSTITGSISQTGGELKANISATTIEGSYSQSGGRLTSFSATNSTIKQGITLTNVAQNGISPQLDFSGTTVDKGLITSNINGILAGSFSNNSTINGGFQQTNRGRVHLVFENSTLNDGVQVKNGGGIQNGTISDSFAHATALEFFNGATLNGGATSNNHSLYLNFENGGKAQGGDFVATGGDFYLRGANNADIQANITSQVTGETRVYLSNSTLKGNIKQDTGKQHISMILKSTIEGSITNTNTQSVFANDEASTLKGNYTQNNGSLLMLLGGESTITGDVTLNSVDTKLGNGTAKNHKETIKGNLTQNNGTLKGNIEGLTLEGKFTQNQGESDITFGSADFKQETTINNATLSKILFDNNSNLITTTLKDSKGDNIFTLDHITTLTGDFILSHSKVILGVKNGSKITGSIKSTDADNDLKLDFEGTGNEIGGDLEIKNGNLDGNLTGTTVGGKIELTDAQTHLHIINSTVNKGIKITSGYTLMTIDNSTINSGFTMTGTDKNGANPTLGLSINNGTIINGDLKFQNTTAALGGFGNGNKIAGNLISTNTTLGTGGDNFAQAGHEPTPTSISGLTITGELKQEQGSFDLIFSNKSNIQGQTALNNGDRSHLTLDNSSLGSLTINQGKDNYIFLKNRSEQNGVINFQSTKAILKAIEQSSLKANISSNTTTATKSNTTILLNNSTLAGNITQSNGILSLDYANHSNMIGQITANNLEKLQGNLESSSILGDMTIVGTTTHFNITNHSSISGNLTLSANPNVEINANASSLSGSITHNGTPNDGKFELNLNFINQSTLNNIVTTINGDMKIVSENSEINSNQGFNIALGVLDLSLSGSTGTIASIETGGQNTISILTTNSSNSTIENIKVGDNAKLTILGQNSAILSGNLFLNETSNTTISSLQNANLKINITPQATTSLTISLNGGILEGTITQNPQNSVGTMALGTAGNFGGRWIATGDSSIKNFNITNSSGNVANELLMLEDTYTSNISMLDTTRDAGGISRIGMNMIKAGGNPPQVGETLERTISMESLSGLNGVFRVYTDIGAEASDKISAGSATGNHIMQVYYNPATFTEDIGNRYIVVAHVDDNQTTASFEGGSTMVGTQIYKTSLTKVPTANGGFDWILGKTQNAGANYGTKVISSILQSQYRSFALQTESLRQRMGELRDINRVHGLWGRYTMGSTYTPESDVAVEIEDNFYSAWIGYDQNILDLKGQDFFGFALSYSLLSPQGEDYSGNVHSIGFNFYNTFIARNDFYVDLVIKYILSMANYEISYYSLAKNTPEYLNHKLMLNAEIGKKFKLSESKNYFFLQPEAQITAGYIFGDEVDFIDFTQTTISSSTSGIAPVILRTGLTAGYSFNQGIKSDFYIGTSFFYETTNGGDVHLDDGNNTVDYSHKGTFKMSFQGGLDLLFTDNARVYFEAGTSFLGKTNMTYSINAGARFSFGYKNTRKLIVPSSITPPHPPQEPYDPRNIPVITDYTQEDIRNNNSAKPRVRGGGDDYFINTRKAYRDKSTIQKTIRSR